MRTGVVGAGLMGAEIALVFSLAGHDVLLVDRDRTALDRAIDRLLTLMCRAVSHGRFPDDQIAPVLARIRPTLDLTHFCDREIVTEAVSESVDVKAGLLAQLDTIVPASCLIASNTSTIPISTLARRRATRSVHRDAL